MNIVLQRKDAYHQIARYFMEAQALAPIELIGLDVRYNEKAELVVSARVRGARTGQELLDVYTMDTDGKFEWSHLEEA